MRRRHLPLVAPPPLSGIEVAEGGHDPDGQRYHRDAGTSTCTEGSR